MRYLVGLVLFLMALGTLRVVGCGDDRIPCETAEDCDDDNDCTDDFCDHVDSSVGYCRNTEVGHGLYNTLPFLCDVDGVEQLYEDGVCVSRTCEKREPPTALAMCTDYICSRNSDVLYQKSMHQRLLRGRSLRLRIRAKWLELLCREREI